MEKRPNHPVRGTSDIFDRFGWSPDVTADSALLCEKGVVLCISAIPFNIRPARLARGLACSVAE
jgi:hypothetical protein